MTASPPFRRLAAAEDAELAALLRTGGRVEPADVAGSTWRGWNRGRLFGLLRQRKFIKRFGAADRNGIAIGENVLARQDGLDRPWRGRLGGRGIFPFAALPPARGPDAAAPRQALVIAYGAMGRSRLNPVGWIVDHLVRIDDGPGCVLLGESLLLPPFGGRWLIEYFVLERVDAG